MATHMGSAFRRLGFGLSSAASVEKPRFRPGTTCSVGTAAPRSSSPPKGRHRDRGIPSPALPALEAPIPRDASFTALTSLVRDSSRAPSQRPDASCSVSLCDSPPTAPVQWGLAHGVDGEDSLRPSPVGFAGSDSPAAPPATLDEWLAAEVGQPLSWQRSMLETHWLLDPVERQLEAQEPEGGEAPGAEDGSAEAAQKKTRRRRQRRKMSEILEEAALLPPAEVPAEPSVEPQARVVVRSQLSARARRLASRQRSSDLLPSSVAKVSLKGRIEPAVAEVPVHMETSLDVAVGADDADVSIAANKTAKQQKDGEQELTSNFVGNFMRDIGKAKLLTREEEVELASAFRAGEELKEKLAELENVSGRKLSVPEWAYHCGLHVRELRQRLREGERARERLIAANMRLVVSVAKKYTRQGVQISDLITAGVMGLSKGVDRFDPSRGFKLSTYVHWWIRQSVTRAVADYTGAIRLPMHVHETLAKVRKAKASIIQQGSKPNATNIASSLGISEKRINKLHKLKLNARSLDEAVPCPVGFSEGSSYHHFIHDQDEETRQWHKIEAMLLKKDMADILMSKLDARERDIICMHFGLRSKDGVGMTLDNISLRYGVSRERIRQVETVAMRKLRVLCARKDLQRYCY